MWPGMSDHMPCFHVHWRRGKEEEEEEEEEDDDDDDDEKEEEGEEAPVIMSMPTK
jgi:hypothetical protein